MKKNKVFLTSTAVLLSALGANPVLARDVEHSSSSAPVATVPTTDDKTTSTASTDSENGKNLVQSDASSAKPAPPMEAGESAPADSSVNPSSEVLPAKPESTDPDKGESVEPEDPPVESNPSVEPENLEAPATETESQIASEESTPTESPVLPEAWQPTSGISTASANLSVSSAVSMATVATSLTDADKRAAASELQRLVERKQEQSEKREKDSLVDFDLAQMLALPVREKVSASSPLLTDQGFQVIGSDKGRAVVQNSDGSQSVVPLAQVGGTADDDGTVTVKSSDGKFVLLPELGETTTLFATIGLFVLSLLGFKQIKPFERENWIIG